MSWDFGIVAPDGARLYDDNCTSNCSGLWHRAFEATGAAGHFADALEAQAAEVAPLLAVMLDWIQSQPADWVPSFDAPNGWGTGRGAVETLQRLHAACVEHPTGTVWVWR